MEHSESSRVSNVSIADKMKQAFGVFLLDVAALLTFANVRKLAMLLNFSPAEIDEAERDPNPGFVFLKSLREKGIINPTDISTLLDALKEIGLLGIVNEVEDSFRRNLTDTHIPSLLPSRLQGKVLS